MTPEQIKAAREALGLTQAQLGRLLDTDGQTVRRLEMDPAASTARRPAPRMVRLLEAYLAGYRPADWPDTEAAGASRPRARAARVLEEIADKARRTRGASE